MARLSITVFLLGLILLALTLNTAEGQETTCTASHRESDCGSKYSHELQDQSREHEEIRIVVVGKTGVGKSTTINTIAGEKLFKAGTSSSSVTHKVDFAHIQVEGRSWLIVDTPGIFDTNVPINETMIELAKVMIITSPGVHVFLIVIRINRFTEEEYKTIQLLEMRFGPQLYERAVIVFTGYDDLEADDITFENYIENSNDWLKKVINACGNRTIPFTNRLKNNRDVSKHQVKILAKTVDKVMKSKNYTYYTNEVYEAYEKEIQEITKKQLDKEKQEKEELKNAFENLKAENEKLKQNEEKLKQMEKELQEMEKLLRFSLSCVNVKLRGSQLKARCKDISGGHHDSEIELNNYIENIDGLLKWQQNGNFVDSSHNIVLAGAMLRCQSKTRKGEWQRTSINLHEKIVNSNGKLICKY